MSDERTVPRICEQCGKDFLCRPGQVRRGEGRFCSRSCAGKIRTGERNQNWKGGRRQNALGYVVLRLAHHPSADKYGFIYEHRLVMERELGRPLLPTEEVHHLGPKTDNRPWSLEVMTGTDHRRLHQELRRQLRALLDRRAGKPEEQ